MDYFPNLTKGVVEISNKIPLKDFYTSYNFIINKIKQYEAEQKLDLINEIFEKLNTKEVDLKIFGNNYDNIFEMVTNKILLYILFYYQNVRTEDYKHYKELMIQFHSKKLIELKKESLENVQKELDNLIIELIKDNNISLSEIFDIYDNYKKNMNNLSETLQEDIETLNNQFDKILINYINEKIKDGKNNKLLEEYYNRLSQENKKIFNNKIMKNISEQAKGSLDLILFGDM